MADNTDQPQASPSRAALRRFMASRDGMVRGMKERSDPQGVYTAHLAPGSMEYPPCRCPRCGPPDSGRQERRRT
ncbi:hypothetical protein [Streptomyces sp. bgisy100]|uniref:hypothetical protein n=1 Tax=Streptomyces sp. bgisy100 TaxID=3413783 RepID=UPI003D71F518